jgi:hypothetical protein
MIRIYSHLQRVTLDEENKFHLSQYNSLSHKHRAHVFIAISRQLRDRRASRASLIFADLRLTPLQVCDYVVQRLLFFPETAAHPYTLAQDNPFITRRRELSCTIVSLQGGQCLECHCQHFPKKHSAREKPSRPHLGANKVTNDVLHVTNKATKEHDSVVHCPLPFFQAATATNLVAHHSHRNDRYQHTSRIV